MHPLPQRRSNVHQSIQREARDSALQQVIDVRLRDAAVTCGFGPCPAACFDQRSDLAHQIGAHAQVRGFFGGVGNGVPDAREAVEPFRFVMIFCKRQAQFSGVPVANRVVPAARIAKRRVNFPLKAPPLQG